MVSTHLFFTNSLLEYVLWSGRLSQTDRPWSESGRIWDALLPIESLSMEIIAEA